MKCAVACWHGRACLLGRQTVGRTVSIENELELWGPGNISFPLITEVG